MLLQILKRNSEIRALRTQVKGTVKTQNHRSQIKTILFGLKNLKIIKPESHHCANLDSFLKGRVHRMALEICPDIS